MVFMSLNIATTKTKERERNEAIRTITCPIYRRPLSPLLLRLLYSHPELPITMAITQVGELLGTILFSILY
jgi:hypothetical protein